MRSIITALALSVMAAPAWAADLIDNFNDWSAFADSDRGRKRCYIASAPTKERGKYTKRGDTYMTVTHIPGENSLGVVSVRAGYTYKDGSEVKVAVGSKTFRLFTRTGHAWTYDSKDDRALVRAMKGGRDMVVKGTSSRGTKTTDTYSLMGFTAAYKAIGRACDVK